MFVVAALCPEAPGVAAQLEPLTTPAQRQAAKWEVAREAAGVQVRLLDGAGRVQRTRTLPAEGDCAALERASAVVIAAWLAQLPAPRPLPEVAVAAPAPKPKPKPVAPPPPEPRPPAAPEVAAPPPDPEPEAAPPPPTPAVVIVETPLPPEEAPLSLEVSLAAMGQLADAFAPGFVLRVDGGRRFGLFAEVSTAWERRAPLPPAEIAWSRAALGVGARWRFELGRFWLEPAASVEGALVWVQSLGVSQPAQQSGVDLSMCGHLRGGLPLVSGVGVLVGLRGCGWPLENSAGVAGVDGVYRFPRWELGVLAGVSWSFWAGVKGR